MTCRPEPVGTAKVVRAGCSRSVGSILAGPRWRRCALACLLVLSVYTLAGCGGGPPSERLVHARGTSRAALALTPYPPAPMQDVTLALALQDGGQPVTGESVVMTLTMPGCSMPPSVVVASEVRAGVYEAQTVLTMAGTWQADVDVALSDHIEHLTFFFATQ